MNIPARTADSWAWQLEASCRSSRSEFFYDFDEHPEFASVASAICSACPVQLTCLTFAIETNEAHGIWGGLDPRERVKWKWLNYRPHATDTLGAS
ncbi:WhiB family transcriptional regulator [Rhodococcus sp. Eu-32]|nr:WhiB family transcriptional regulator [Rhodococcus sp. Eu-32]RRQ25676.1 WhiB family transcriptional regulator [Rhodococcus sp. Eu-32]